MTVTTRVKQKRQGNYDVHHDCHYSYKTKKLQGTYDAHDDCHYSYNTN